jgi:putative FmdB family regulatory protein
MTYEYMCTACGHAWEAEQSISAAALKTCPSCHQETARRQVSGGAGFILKGGGWYADLYGSAPKKTEAAKPGGKSEAAPAKTESTSSDGGSKSGDKGSSGSSGSSSSGSSGTPTSGTPSGSKATGAASGA